LVAHDAGMVTPGIPTRNSRGASADARLHRLKRAIVAGSAVLGLALWTLIAGSVSAGASGSTVSTPSSIDLPHDSFFDTGQAALGPGTGLTPMLRSGGS
jgi:hypothetical protein